MAQGHGPRHSPGLWPQPWPRALAVVMGHGFSWRPNALGSTAKLSRNRKPATILASDGPPSSLMESRQHRATRREKRGTTTQAHVGEQLAGHPSAKRQRTNNEPT